MTQIKTIKATAKAAFEEKNYPLAFQTLWKAGVSDFIRFGENQSVKIDKLFYNWFTYPDSAEFFWKTFILNEAFYTELINSDLSEQFLHNYFSKSAIFSSQFEIKLANEYPLKLINAVRVSQLFLKPDRIEELCSLHLPNELIIHQKVWRKVFDIDKITWREIEDELFTASRQPLTSILLHAIIWLETNRFQNPQKETIHHLASVYSFFIEMLFSKYPKKSTEQLGSDVFLYQNLLKLANELDKEEKAIDKSPTVKTLNQISAWINYRDCVISPYSFDLHIQLKQENELILFNISPEFHYKWRLDGVRYEINQLHYLLHGAEMLEYLEENNEQKIPGKTEEEISWNRKLAELKWSTLLMLHDMGINTFRFGQDDVNVEILLTPLLAHSYNRIIRYEFSLAKHSEDSKSWIEAFLKQYLETMLTTIRREPFLLMSKDEFKELNKMAMERLTEESAQQVLQIASYEINSKGTFNRFNCRYDVFQKPLFRIGDNLFCPMIFYASNVWFYTFTQEALTRNEGKKTERNETKVMEVHFGELLRQKGWAVKVSTEKDATILDGDVDIFVEDNWTLLFIQLKRSHFRLTLKDAYYESFNSDKKAALQLNKAETFLKTTNAIYTVTKKPIKWIASTSFENIGADINGCKKVNYFDVLRALNNPETKDLNDLVIDVERDRNIKKLAFNVFDKEIPEEARLSVYSTGLPLEMFDIKAYKQPIFSDDESKTRSYNELFNHAITLDKNGQKNEALILLQKCIELSPNDAEAYGAIANILSDLNQYENVYGMFAKALELAPNDPYITRNYSVALEENGRNYESLCLALKMFEKFPLLDNTWALFRDHFERCVQNGVLAPEQIIELQIKWNSLN